MKVQVSRRMFSASLIGSLSAVATTRKLKVGYTCIIWGTFPRNPEAIATLEPALKDISSLGAYGFETFPQVLEDWDSKGALSGLIEKYKVPLTSAYYTCNLTDPAARKETLATVIRMAKIVKKYGGTYLVLAPNSVKRDSYDFQAHKAGIVAGLNEYAMAVTDLGLGTGLHQHTGTCVETRDEVYAVMEAVNTKYMKFAPDVGQLQKGGADAAKVVKDFLPLITHVHLKDFNGGEHFAGYCPLGQGKVDVAAILDMLESGGKNPALMVELDPSKNQPMTPLETATISKAYLEKAGYKFRS